MRDRPIVISQTKPFGSRSLITDICNLQMNFRSPIDRTASIKRSNQIEEDEILEENSTGSLMVVMMRKT